MKPVLAALLALTALGATTEPTTQPRDPNEIRRGIVMGENREERAKRVYENIIRKVEPKLVGDVAKLPIYLDLFKREFVEDPRQFTIDLTPQQTDGKWFISGYVEFIEHQRALTEFLRYLSLEQVENKIDLLPRLESATLPLALTTAPRCFVHDRKEGKGETLTECLAGDPVFVLQDQGKGRVLAHAKSGYVGWIDPENLKRATEADFDAAINARPPDPRIDKVIDAAKKLMGTRYVWGGLTADGIDCSGLVNRSFATVGVVLPRDADQQSLAGSLVATRWHRSALRKGDVLFFLGRRGTISHTALYLGENQYIEATDPGVKITSFNPQDSNYEKRRDEGFAFAKRMIE